MGIAPGPEMDEISYEINQDFVAPDASPQELQQMMLGFVQGTIPSTDYIRFMQRAGVFDGEKPIEEYQEEIDTVSVMPGQLR
jgi:hypothetical protein